MIDSIVNIFNIVLYQPIVNILVFFYNIIPGRDLGIAIIVLTLVIRFILYPISAKAIKSQKRMKEIQPKIKEIQKKYKDDKAQQSQKIMELYRKEKFNPFGGCLPILIQLPILLALFRVLKNGIGEELGLVYSFITTPETIEPLFLGFLNLTQANVGIAILAALFQFFQTKMMTSMKSDKKDKSDFSQAMQKQMTYFFPFFTFFILLSLPSAIGLYWMVNSLFGIGQQHLLFKKKNNE